MDRMTEIVSYHKEWVKIVSIFGAKNNAEDIVQDTYIKIMTSGYVDRIFQDGTISKAYIWLTLRSVYFNYYNKQKRNPEVNYEIDESLVEDIPDESNEEQLLELERQIDNLDWYSKKLIKINMKGKSIRQMEKEIGIQKIHIFRSLKQAKEQIRDNYGK